MVQTNDVRKQGGIGQCIDITGKPVVQSEIPGDVPTDDFSQPQVLHEHDWYDSSIRAMDAELGRLIETLDELGLHDDTLLAFIADHGEEFLEHGSHWHGENAYGENSNVPLVLWSPGRIPAGLRVSETVQSIDLMPTLLELSELSAPDGVQGQSLVPMFAGNAGEPWRSQGTTHSSDRPSNSIKIPATYSWPNSSARRR